ncbi:MAG: hypothetical protein EOM73_03890 [Bacteroidia bacterium]|nr:hypothetical protein [Bacteroidia bacterium]
MKEKDNIEEFIIKNIDGLNDFEPREGHFDRFEAKLKVQHKRKKITLNQLLKIAAAVIFVLLGTNQAFLYFSPGNHPSVFSAFGNDEVTLASVSPEYEEVEFYYTNSINVGLSQWKVMKNEGLISGEEEEMMQSELAEFETMYKNLQQDLASNPNDERVINAMLDYYQAKLSVINMIVDKLKEVKHQTNTSHEIKM